MRKFKLIEEQSAFREYEIEAESFEDAYDKWLCETEDVENACSNVDWEFSNNIELYRIDDIKNNDYWYCS